MDMFTQIVVVIGRKGEKGITMLGTGFFINGGQYIITPRHVVNDDDKNLVIILPDIQGLNEYQDTSIKNCSYADIELVNTDPFRDIAVLKTHSPSRTYNIPIKNTDEMNVLDEVLIVGFPHCVEGRKVLTVQKANIGAKVLLEANNIKSKCIVVNTQTRPGQSGSLIYDVKRQCIIAMLLGAFSIESGISLGGINPRELHQTTHCVSAEHILKMIKED